MIVAAKSGYRPYSVAVALRAGSVNTITLMLIAQAVSVEAMIVTATRGERRVEDTPRRVAKGSCECGAYTKRAMACRHGPHNCRAVWLRPDRDAQQGILGLGQQAELGRCAGIKVNGIEHGLA